MSSPLHVGAPSHLRIVSVARRVIAVVCCTVLSAGVLLVPGSALAQLPSGVPSEPAPAPSTTPPPPQPSATPAEPAPQPATGERVAEVKVSGNQRIETSAILTPLETKADKPYDPKTIQHDIRTLWDQKFYRDIQVDVTDSPDGKVVTFIVKEKPFVREISITGNEEIDDDDIKKEVEVKPLQVYDAELARKTVKKIEGKYADKGYFLAEVKFDTKPAPGNNLVDVHFQIIEHAKVEVRRITFLGNKALTDDEIKGSLGTQEGGFLSFLTSQGTYKEEVFQRDLLVIQSLYLNKGYLNVRVGHPSIALSADKREIFITIPIDEGQPYDYGDIEFTGDLLGDDEALKKLLTISKGQRVSYQDVQKNIVGIEDHFRDKGYANVQVRTETPTDVQARVMGLRFAVSPGEKIYIERIDIVGNTKTRDKVIRREMKISEGDLYNATAIKISRARVTALGFFEAVDITSKPGTRPNTLRMEVAIKEKATGTFQVGLGFSNQEPILLNANVSQNNALGWGVSAALMAQVSRLRRIFSLSYTDPYFLDTNWTFAFDLFNTLQIYTNFERSALGGTITGGYQLFEDFRIFLTYTLQQVNVVPSTANTVLFANRFRGGLTSSVKFSFNYDKRDNRLFPTNGYFLNGSVEFAHPEITASQTQFTRWLGIARFYHPLGAGFVFKVNSTIGYIQSPADNPVPVSELFFEGGINSLRGFNFREVAPLVQAGQTPGTPLIPLLIGGNKELLTNWEVEFPIVEDAGLRGVVFFDAGNVYSESQTFFDASAGGTFGLLMSVGFGARWFTPLGPLRFEWGFPVSKRVIDPSNRLEFTIGNFF